MKYKIGQKVKIKEYYNYKFIKDMEEDLNKLNCNRILTIHLLRDDYYHMKEIGWYWNDSMIECLAKDYIIDNTQKTFRDLLGRDIKIGDNVLHLWTKVDRAGYAQGGKGSINKKLATVVKQTKKGIGIEWRDSHNKKMIKKSTIYNTMNRLIILNGESLALNYDDVVHDVEKSYEKYKKSMRTRNKNLTKKSELEKEQNDKLTTENTKLKQLIKELTKGSERFELLDLR